MTALARKNSDTGGVSVQRVGLAVISATVDGQTIVMSPGQAATLRARLDGVMRRPPLSPARRAVLEFMRRHEDEHGLPPTLRQIADALSRSRVVAFEHVQTLVNGGYVNEGPPHTSRRYSVNREEQP